MFDNPLYVFAAVLGVVVVLFVLFSCRSWSCDREASGEQGRRSRRPCWRCRSEKGQGKHHQPAS